MKSFTPGVPVSGLVFGRERECAVRGGPAAQHSDWATLAIVELLSLAERLNVARERRLEFLPNELFAEPAWNMLIALFQADAVGRAMTVSNITIESRVPSTTALRWIDSLVELGLARRTKNPLDARVTFIELEDKGRAAMHRYLCHIWTVFYGSDQALQIRP